MNTNYPDLLTHAEHMVRVLLDDFRAQSKNPDTLKDWDRYLAEINVVTNLAQAAAAVALAREIRELRRMNQPEMGSVPEDAPAGVMDFVERLRQWTDRNESGE